MKRLSLLLAFVAAVLFFAWSQRGPRAKPVDRLTFVTVPVAPRMETSRAQGDAVPIASPQANFPRAVRPDLDGLRETLRIDRKALRTNAESAAYREALRDSRLISVAVETLGRVSEPTNDDSFHEDQNERMDAALFLSRGLEWKENPRADEIKDAIRELVLDQAVTNAADERLKKSLVADRIELYANLRAIDASAGQEIARRAETTSSKKLIQFANNFYGLGARK